MGLRVHFKIYVTHYLKTKTIMNILYSNLGKSNIFLIGKKHDHIEPVNILG